MNHLARMTVIVSGLAAFHIGASESSQASGTNPALDKAIADWAREDGMRVPRHETALIDLNGDSILDAIVIVDDEGWCGSGGCTMVIFKGTPKGFTHNSGSPASREPIRVLNETRNGWHTISVLRAGGGGPSRHSLLRFNGAKYVDANKDASAVDLKGATTLVFRQ